MPSPNPENVQMQAEYANFDNPYDLTSESIAQAVHEAVTRIEGVAVVTPLETSPILSSDNAEVLVKDETEQPTNGFKVRGASNAVAYWSEQGIENFVTSTRGTHGAALALAARHFNQKAQANISATVFVPSATSQEKQRLIRSYGARLIEVKADFEQTLRSGLDYSENQDGKFVHPFINPLVIAGQGTIGLEVLDQAPDVDVVVTPWGGGGMTIGVASAIRESRKDVQIVAAQVEGCDSFARSLESGSPLQGQKVDTKFEGVAVGSVDPITFELGQSLVDRVMVVSVAEVYRTIYDTLIGTGKLLEAAGALAPAAARLLAQESDLKGAKIVAVASGANPADVFDGFIRAKARRLGW